MASPHLTLASSQPTPGRDWDRLIAQHSHAVVVALLGAGVRIDQAKELTQQTWLKLIELDREGKLPEVRLPGLALRQARFLMIDLGRKEAADRRRELAVASEALTVVDPERSALGRERLQAAFEAIREAPLSGQRVFRMVYEDPRLSHAEIAERLGLSTQRVRQALCEVRKQIRRALEDAR